MISILKTALELCLAVLQSLSSPAATAAPAAPAADYGILADFTAQASVITNFDARSYEHFFYDYDGDGEEEMFYLVGYDNKDGLWPLAARIFEGEGYKSTNWSPPKAIPDCAEIRTVCFIDINPDDGRKDLVISAVAQDGSEYTTILQGADENSDEHFGRQWKDDHDKPIFSGLFRGVLEDGSLVIGDTLYVYDEKYWVKEAGKLEPGAMPFPEPEPAEPTAAPEPTAVPEDPTEAPAPAEPTAAPEPGSAGGTSIQTEVKYTGVAFSSQGIEMDASVMPEYSVIFHADGSASFTMAGNELPVLQWTADGEDVVIEYAKQQLRFVPEGDGFTVDIFGTITVRMSPQ